ncbi:MAG: GNAT family N-acetyltransferase [Alphaproteobacteria bacterium]|nr:GNAT family N-acetyltransferase [Alphaproteobacteria bacterium]
MLDRIFAPDRTPELIRGELLLRAARPSDYAEWRDVRLASHAFLKPFEPRWSEVDLSPAVFRERLRRNRREAEAGTEFSFFIFNRACGQHGLCGGLTLSNIRRRAAMHGNLGYWMNVDSAGKGIMTEAVHMLLPFAFNDLELRRLNAACLPDNTASRRVLEKNGFREEGFAEAYLQIDGIWRDHVLYGLTRDRYLKSRG